VILRISGEEYVMTTAMKPKAIERQNFQGKKYRKSKMKILQRLGLDALKPSTSKEEGRSVARNSDHQSTEVVGLRKFLCEKV
jgi:hypothetical protein